MKGFEPVLVKTAKGEGSEYGISWFDGMEKVFMPLNLDKHWMAVEIRPVEGKNSLYNSLQTTTHARHAVKKLTPIDHMLPDL